MSKPTWNPDELPLVPETVLRKRRSLEESRAKIAAQKALSRPKKQSTQRTPFKNAEQFVKDFRVKENQQTRIKRQQKQARLNGKTQKFLGSLEGKMVFAVVIRPAESSSKQYRKILSKLRLHTLHTGVFLRMDAYTSQLLAEVAPLVAYGTPSRKSVEGLIRKRGFGKIKGKRVPLSDNVAVEDHLGKFGIICIEDLAHELCSVGSNFNQAASFLWPFKMRDQHDKYTKNILGINSVGAHGYRASKIDKFIQDCL